MSTYNNKKKLLEENKDVYISDYDKNLDYSYLADIIDQKKAYAKAENAGDANAMREANNRANSIRLQAGSYTAGDDGSKYNRIKTPYENDIPKKTRSSYSNEKDRIYDMIDSYGDFEYDIYTDPMYKAYKEIYLSLGDDAYERALGENAMRTGGTYSTSALSAATAAKNKYNSMLSSKVPELYEKAYSRYRDGLDDLYDMLDAASEMEKYDYLKYRDDMNDYKDSREYYYKKDKNISDSLYDLYKDETDYNLLEEERMAKKENEQQDTQLEKLQLAVNLAKALYGKTRISQGVINSIMSMIE